MRTQEAATAAANGSRMDDVAPAAAAAAARVSRRHAVRQFDRGRAKRRSTFVRLTATVPGSRRVEGRCRGLREFGKPTSQRERTHVEILHQITLHESARAQHDMPTICRTLGVWLIIRRDMESSVVPLHWIRLSNQNGAASRSNRRLRCGRISALKARLQSEQESRRGGNRLANLCKLHDVLKRKHDRGSPPSG